MRVWYVIVGASAVTSFAAVGLAALPAKGRGGLLNFLGFWLPAVATIGDMDQATDHRKAPWVFTGYWVRADGTNYRRSTLIGKGETYRNIP